MKNYILVINPGSTSTKLAIFQGESELLKLELPLRDEQLDLPLFPDQYVIRKGQILKALEKSEVLPSQLRAIAARGGRLKPLKSGVYRVNERMVEDAREGLQGVHPSNTAVVIAAELAREYGPEAFTVDPISVDELADWARVTGIKGIERNSLSHALNMKEAARRVSRELGKPYERARIIVAHLGGGSSISAHSEGKMVDLYNSDKEGPFAVERAGSLPTHELAEFARFQEGYLDFLTHRGGLYSHFQTRDLEKIVELAKGDESALLVIKAYVYNIVKYIFSLLAVFKGYPDALVLTGGVMKSQYIKEKLLEGLGGTFNTFIYPGEFEMESLASGVLRVLSGQEAPLDY